MKKDLQDERSALMLMYPGQLSFILPPAGTEFVRCDDDADHDNVTNAADDCPSVFNPDQTDSQGNGVGNACRITSPCDVDFNGQIDRLDISYILAARGLKAVLNDPRDADRDGIITANDARVCALRCTKTGCLP